MPTVEVHSAEIRGYKAVPIEVEVNVSQGLPGFRIFGLKAAMAEEAIARVRCAMVTAGFAVPLSAITVNLRPADMNKYSTGYDLPIAMGILAATGQIPAEGLENSLVVGELSLAGNVEAVRGEVAYRHFAQEANLEFIYPKTASLSLAKEGMEGLSRATSRASLNLDSEAQVEQGLDFADVVGNESVKRACVIAAAGKHNLLLVGPPDSGKTMAARRMTTILPALTDKEYGEVMQLHSVCGDLVAQSLRGGRPFRAPHSSITIGGMVGGGRPILPGEVSLAHNGVLFLEDLADFSVDVLKSLSLPLQEKEVRLVRVDGVTKFPADTLLVASARPCPCGHFGDVSTECHDSPSAIMNYQHRLGKAAGGAFELVAETNQPSAGWVFGREKGMTSAEMATIVAEARERASWRERRMDTHQRLGAEHGQIDCLDFDADAIEALKSVSHKLAIGPRSIASIARVARTIADMACHDTIQSDDVLEGCAFRNEFGVPARSEAVGDPFAEIAATAALGGKEATIQLQPLDVDSATR